MYRARDRSAVVLIAALAAVSLAIAQGTERGSAVGTVIRGATLIDGNGGPPIRDAVVVVKGNRIAAAGAAAAVEYPKDAYLIDARGDHILPGLIDAHCHVEDIGLGDLASLPHEWQDAGSRDELSRINAALDLQAGVTAVRDPGSTDRLFQIRREIEAGKTPGPRVFAAGHQLVKQPPGAQLDPTFTAYDGVESARAAVRAQIALGADFIKVRLVSDAPLPSIAELRAIVEEAHAQGRRVAVHTWVPADQALQLAIDAGVDSIEHNAPLRAKSAEVLAEMARRHIALMPGGGGFYVQRWDAPDPAEVLDPRARRMFAPDIVALFTRVGEALRTQTNDMKRQGWSPSEVQARFTGEMARARKAGVTMVFGTDCGGEIMVHGQQYKALYGETRMGSTPMEALLMATRDAARVLGKERDLGTIEPGKLADLLVVGADPLADMRNLSKVRLVMLDGRIRVTAR